MNQRWTRAWTPDPSSEQNPGAPTFGGFTVSVFSHCAVPHPVCQGCAFTNLIRNSLLHMSPASPAPQPHLVPGAGRRPEVEDCIPTPFSILCSHALLPGCSACHSILSKHCLLSSGQLNKCRIKGADKCCGSLR